MHLLIGYVLARILKQKKVPGERLPVLKGVFEVVHRIPGRIRFRIPLLAGAGDEIIAAMDTELLSIPDIESVQIDPISASLLVRYNQEKIKAPIICGIVLKLLDFEKTFDQAPTSMAARELKDLGRALDLQVYNSTAGMLDLQSGISIVIFGLALYLLLIKRERSLPSGISLLWWSYVIFKSKG